MEFGSFFGQFKALPESWERLSESGKPVCIYGTGDACERILSQFELRGISCAGIFASDDFLRGGREFHGFEVTSLSALEERFKDITVCCAFGSQLPDVMAQIEGIAARHDLIFPDLPVAGDELFSRRGLIERQNDLARVYDMLADDLSREVLRGVLGFKLTGDIGMLRSVFSDPAKDAAALIAPKRGDCYADLGAYNGDTVASFAGMCPDHGQIVAFEPDVRSFRKCVARHIGRENITFVNACAWCSDGNIGFSQSAGRQSQITGGGRLTAARRLDTVLAGKRCDVIKLDVEGAEREALIGAAETIKRYSPRMIVSAYHRPYDLIDLSLQLSGMGDYDLYIRQPPYYPAWDTCIYAVPKITKEK